MRIVRCAPSEEITRRPRQAPQAAGHAGQRGSCFPAGLNENWPKPGPGDRRGK